MSMSASAGQIPMSNVGWAPTSPLGALAQWNDVQKGGLQNTGLGLQNQQAQLMLGLRGQLAGAIGVGPNGQPMMPGQAPPGGMGAPPGGMAGGPPGPGQLMPGGGQPAGTPDPTAGLQPVSPYAMMSPYGVPMPRAQMIAAVMSNDPMKAITDSYNMGRQRVTQILTQAGDVNDPDPAKQAQSRAMVKAAAGQLYTEGWIDPNAYQTLMSDPAKANQFIRGTASPDEHMKQATAFGVKGLTTDSNGQVVYDPSAAAGLATTAGQVSGAEAGAKVGPAIAQARGEAAAKAPYGPLQEIKVPVTDKNGAPVLGSDGQPTFETRYVHPGIDTPAGAAGAGAAPAGSGGAGQPGVTPTKVFNALVGTEASQANATSPKGATGKAQIVQGTFDQYKLPGESYGNEDDRVAAARRYVDDMWKKYPGDTARVAVGYFSGVGNVAPAGSPTPWIKNTSDGNMQVSQYVDRFGGKLGVSPTKVATNTSVTPVATDAGGAAPAEAPAEAPTPQPGAGGLQGQPAPTPQQAADLGVQTKAREADITARAKEVEETSKAYGDVAGKIVQAGQDSATKLQRLDVLQNAAADFRPGATAEVRAAAMKRTADALQATGITPPDWMMKGATGAEVISKEGGYLAAEMTRTLGAREAASVFNQIKSIQPNMDMSTGGFNAVISSIRQGVMRDSDLAAYQDQWLSTHKSIASMTAEFNKTHPVEAYASRVVPYPMPKDNAELKPNVIYRAPNGKIALYNGTGFIMAPNQ
jgi:hypothetical protein